MRLFENYCKDLIRIDSGTDTAEDVARAGQEAHRLGLFVRGLVGLDSEGQRRHSTVL